MALFIETPLPQTAAYQGHEGYLYPGGNNVPTGYQTRVAPKYATLEADNEVVILCLGMSNMRHTCDVVKDKLTDPRIVIINSGISGRAQQAWDGSISDQTWQIAMNKVSQAGYTANDIDMAWYFNTWGYEEFVDFNVYLATMRDSLNITMSNIVTLFPNAQLIYLTSREYGGFVVGTLSAEPKPYWDGYAVNDVIATRIASPNEVPILWQAYQWNPLWPESYFRENDGVHLSDLGLDVASDLWISFFVGEPWFGVTPGPTNTPAPTLTPSPTVSVTSTPTIEATATVTATQSASPTPTATTECPPWNPGCSDPQPTRTPWGG